MLQIAQFATTKAGQRIGAHSIYALEYLRNQTERVCVWIQTTISLPPVQTRSQIPAQPLLSREQKELLYSHTQMKCAALCLQTHFGSCSYEVRARFSSAFSLCLVGAAPRACERERGKFQFTGSAWLRLRGRN